MSSNEFNLTTKDGLQLFAQEWQPTQPPTAFVCLVHGLGEHSGRYAHLAAVLNQAGYTLFTVDLRGHGKSAGQRGHAPSYAMVMEDISRLLEEATRRYPHQPGFLYGHSLGGNLAINYVLRCRPALTGVIITSPALRLSFTPPAWKIFLGNLLYHLWPTCSLPANLDLPALSRDPDVVENYRQDKLIHGQMSVRFARDFLDAGEWALQSASEFTLPLLLMQGGADRITSPLACHEFVTKIKGDVTLKIWEDYYHELHNEPEKEQVFAYLLDWLEKQRQRGGQK